LRQSLGAAQAATMRMPAHVARALEAAARESGARELGRGSYRVAFPPAASSGAMRDFAAARRQRAVHVLVGKVASADHVRRVVVLAATVERGRIVHLRRVHSR
ncbi:MAG: hypothetical protein U1E76_28705, partial [Planctomycetota bacterium]